MTRQKVQIYDEIVSRILKELDMEHAGYQILYTKIYGVADPQAKNIYRLLANLCTRIRQDLHKEEK